MSKTINYNNWVFGMYQEFIGNNILDIGSGHGTFIRYIKDKKHITCIEPSSDEFESLKRAFAGLSNISIINGDFNSPEVLNKVKKTQIDTIICLNVLEHIEDDMNTLKNIHSILNPGGKLILYIPALKALYGTMDEALHHFRRYNKKDLEEMLSAAGFKILKIRYMNFLGIFTWFLYSRILKKKMPSVKRLLFYDKYLVPIISAIERLIEIPFGQSILVVCEIE